MGLLFIHNLATVEIKINNSFENHSPLLNKSWTRHCCYIMPVRLGLIYPDKLGQHMTFRFSFKYLTRNFRPKKFIKGLIVVIIESIQYFSHIKEGLRLNPPLISDFSTVSFEAKSKISAAPPNLSDLYQRRQVNSKNLNFLRNPN